jgi:extracellular factor (EF) 3-hydroxypalmitic acid methyl ester biosynthesis protein
LPNDKWRAKLFAMNDRPSEADLLSIAAMQGEELAARLRAAEEATRGWMDRERGLALVSAAVDDSLAALAATSAWGAQNRPASTVLWEKVAAWANRGALIHQARFKPRGYAGDYVMLARICQEWRCEDALGNILDEYFQNHAAPRAVRDRTDMVAGAIVAAVQNSTNEEFDVVSVGSGPAIDVEGALGRLEEESRRRLRITLVDLDPGALEDARARLAKFVGDQQIRPLRENLFRLPQRPNRLGVEAADFVICTGFFDYLSDVDARALLRTLWERVKSGGRLMVFNFAPHNPSRAFMEWLGNWYLVYRDEAAMRGLAASAGIKPEHYRLTSEPLGIDLLIDAGGEV